MKDLTKLPLYCMIDRKPIPLERAARKDCKTCSDECRRKLLAHRRALADARSCRHCGKPSSAEERKAFKKWRGAQPDWKRKLGRPVKAAAASAGAKA